MKWRHFFISFCCIAFISSCSDSPIDLSGKTTVDEKDFLSVFKSLSLPYNVSDTNLDKNADTLTIAKEVFLQFYPDSALGNIMGKSKIYTLSPVGKIEKEKENYLLFVIKENKKLLVYEKYKGFKLTYEGRKIALMVLRKHRLWETFLVKVLHFNWDEVHEVAEQLEHIQSQQLIDHLDDFLGNPAFDPHGDPIPDAAGKIPFQSQMNLNKFPMKTQGEVTAVGSQSPDILSLLEHKKINIGVRIKVLQHFAFDNSIGFPVCLSQISSSYNTQSGT